MLEWYGPSPSNTLFKNAFLTNMCVYVPSTQEEENRTKRIVIEETPLPRHKTTEDPNPACNTNIRDLLWQCR
jgi:hypothetical protein